MKSGREIVEILEAYDLTGSYRAAAELAGCDHHTVARYVKLRDEGRSPQERAHRARPIDEFMDKIEELVVRSGGRVRADVVHRRIASMGFTGGERTTRRAVAAVKEAFRAGRRRVFRPWIPEPGLWMQFDWGEGPRIGGRRTSLWCAWLAWSRFRVVIPTFDKTLPTIAVHLSYASPLGHTLLDVALYLPRFCSEDTTRRTEAGVPHSVDFATKPQLARRLIETAAAGGLPCRWVAGDEAYGGDPQLTVGPRRLRLSYVLAVARSHRAPTGLATQRADHITAGLRRTAGNGCPPAPARRATAGTTGDSSPCPWQVPCAGPVAVRPARRAGRVHVGRPWVWRFRG
ncbi:hypothetical protein GCM10010124_41200 [Pilimelia terevasa]|uniref:Transposase IS701-like DDE domain-containing protein n=1 Tax=Pilimelia terevasa TaxID=53372 RepID=A0A8J3BUG1_9ACTN|nr:transposase [Pilimelia terevasa]GGK44126.1 hypothetical protein GCM10010124_41200 [Pilimelia terevasa]